MDKKKTNKKYKTRSKNKTRNQHFTLETFLLPFYRPRKVRFKPLVRSRFIFPPFFFLWLANSKLCNIRNTPTDSL